MEAKYLIECLNGDKPIWDGALVDLLHLFKSNLITSEQLEFIKNTAETEQFKKDNDCSDEEFQAWMKYNEGRYFTVSLSTFRHDTKTYIEKIVDVPPVKSKIRILDKIIPLSLFERYWRFLINAKHDYIGLDNFETKRAQLHNTIFKSVGLHRVNDRESDLGREILRISDMLERSKNSTFDVEFKKIVEKLRNENLILENDE